MVATSGNGRQQAVSRTTHPDAMLPNDPLPLTSRPAGRRVTRSVSRPWSLGSVLLQHAANHDLSGACVIDGEDLVPRFKVVLEHLWLVTLWEKMLASHVHVQPCIMCTSYNFLTNIKVNNKKACFYHRVT